MIEQPTLAPECEVISARALSRREFFATAGGAFAATMAAIPQVVKALPAAATSLGKVKIRDMWNGMDRSTRTDFLLCPTNLGLGVNLNEEVCRAHLVPGTRFFE